MAQLTELLARMQDGDPSARDELFAAAYPQLRLMARARLRDGGRSSVLETTGLVHDAYLRMVRAGELRAEDRRAFFSYVSQVMRSVIVDAARARITERRGGGQVQEETLSTEIAESVAPDDEGVLRVHEALAVLEAADARLARVVEMRYFGGYSEREIAETLELTERTVQRDWEKARLILAAALRA